MKFLNRVDNPAGELWIFRVRSQTGQTDLAAGPVGHQAFEVSVDPETAQEVSTFLRDGLMQGQSDVHSADATGDELYVRLAPSAAAGLWRLIFSTRVGGGAELHVDEETMIRIVVAMDAALNTY